MPTTPSFSQIDLWRNVLQVSRTHGTSSAQYLTSKGKLANDASKAATIKQLALLVLSQTGLEGYDPSKVVHVNRSFIHMVKEKFTPYTSDVFKYVIDSAFIGQVFSPKLKLV